MGAGLKIKYIKNNNKKKTPKTQKRENVDANVNKPNGQSMCVLS